MVPLLIVVALLVVLGFGLVLVRSRERSQHSVQAGRGPSAPVETVAPSRAPTAETEAPGTCAVDEEPSVVDGAPTSLTDSLARSRGPFRAVLARFAGEGKRIDDDDWRALEEVLLGADLGPGLAEAVVGEVRSQLARNADRSAVVQAIEEAIRRRFGTEERGLSLAAGPPAVVLFVGVNGTGKTTTIGKLAHLLAGEGHRVVVAAGDTFRAAAAEQVRAWAERAGVEVVAGQAGADPASVIFDAIAHAHAVGADVVLCDTAGRLQSKTNLMEELRKIRRVAEKGAGVVTEVLLVLDATTGQNGLRQAMVFHEAADLTGVVLTKLDGSAKGGVAVAIESELDIPIKLVGLGEGPRDLAPFDPDAFVAALVGEAADV